MFDVLKAQFASAIVSSHAQHGDETIVIRRESLMGFVRHLRGTLDLSFDLLMDLTAVDYLRMERIPRFEVVYHFCSLRHRHRLRVKVGIPEEDPWVDSLTGLWPAADWYEREVWDMFGIRFRGHPNLKRILMYESFVGHPLRKDYPVSKRQPLIGSVN